MKGKYLFITLALGLSLTLALLWLLSGSSAAVTAAPVHPPQQATAGVITVCVSGSCDYSTVQSAVDAAVPGDLIKVAAGTYTGVHVRPRKDVTTTGVVTQMVYISKTITIQGGYTTTNWTVPNPVANLTTLDAQGQGRVLYITNYSQPTIEGLRLTGGNAAGLGGPWGDSGGGVYVYTATATISNCVVYSNTGSTASGGNGGGLFLYGSDATLSGNMVQGNTASTASYGNGGGLFLYGSDATLSGNTVQGNTASTASSGWGGGLYLYHSDATLSGNTVQGNTASTASRGGGGGLALFSGSAATLSGNTVQGNTASTAGEGNGGGLWLLESDATLSGNTVRGNTASTAGEGGGGGLQIHTSAATLSDNIVVSNTASSVDWGVGGGLNFLNSPVTLTRNLVQDNLAGRADYATGGGLHFNECRPTLIDNQILNNTASEVGAGEGGGARFLNSPATLIGNLVQGNVASSAGGGLGGGLRLSGGTLTGNWILSNTATLSPTAHGQGGGVDVHQGVYTFTNNVIANNHATAQGGGILFMADVSARLLHTTLAGNQGGSGVYVGGYASNVVTFTNTIIAGHTNVGIEVNQYNTATLEATLWGEGAWANGADWSGGGLIFTGTVNVWGDPAFVDPAAEDYHIGLGSAAIDRGVDAGVTTDIDGESRPAGTGYDLGADEFWYRVYLPLVLRNQ